ncbi:hypothetical protein DEO72_LG1g2759 [Vigna unguiculata]|uniref:Uncharacterized protein n=1 Tax=Vigna unguiculata TaxID=3917 RepID=A0A4D6KR19_VIGUN|nr:hypothetical protein DEO72_LG1g2759 [Vigna unguiculata]
MGCTRRKERRSIWGVDEVKKGVRVVTEGSRPAAPFFFQKTLTKLRLLPSHGSLFFSTPPQLQPLSPFASVSASPHHHDTGPLARRRHPSTPETSTPSSAARRLHSRGSDDQPTLLPPPPFHTGAVAVHLRTTGVVANATLVIETFSLVTVARKPLEPVAKIPFLPPA